MTKKMEEHQEADQHEQLQNVLHVSGMYKNWFLDYASYVILERSVPLIEDGLKPVQRRILHALKELDDGRYHKVANVIGHTMKYHPHGDASIGDALVQIGQKELLLDMQGNWGNILTGDRAAAPRYIEVRLSKFALDVVYNPKITEWNASYDGRGKEPVSLPIKFPLLLAQGVEGIAVGLSTKILPHNFNELIDASIKILKGVKPRIYPDFITGGMADFTNYNDGKRGGKVRVRARVTALDKKTLKVSELPFGTTTTSLINSVLKANDKGKIKIKKVEDNTSEEVEILIHLPPGISPDKTIDALYSFTDCEVSISPLGCVVDSDKPRFLGVSEMLQVSTHHTLDLLKAELEINLKELEEKWHFASLEKIFIEQRIYRDIEECETWEAVLAAIHKGLKPHIKHLLREVTDEDVTRLTEIKIKRISKFDSLKADEDILKLESQIEEIKGHLANLVEYAIDYFKKIKEKYGKGKERKTEIKTFDNIVATKVVAKNQKLYVNREEGFVGLAMKKDEYVCDCSDIDDVIVFRKDGKMMVTKVDKKTFVGKDIIHLAIFKKKDERTTYNMIYKDGASGKSFMKRFQVTSVTRDKEYDLAKGGKSEVLYFTANPNGEAEVVTVHLRALQKLKKLRFDIDFSELAIKGRGAGGNLVSKTPIKKIELKEAGVSTLSARKIWYDDTVMRLNVDGRGEFLGEFQPTDKILVISQKGEIRLLGFDLTTRFDDDMLVIEKWRPQQPISTVYFDGEKERYFVKRFLMEETDKIITFISESEDSQLEVVSTDSQPLVEVLYKKEKGKDRKVEKIALADFIAVKGITAQGNKLSNDKINEINLLEPIPVEENEVENTAEELEADDKPVVVEEKVETAVVVEEVETEEQASEEKEKKKETKSSKKKEEVQPEKKSSTKIIIDEDSTDNQFKLEL
jgi:topoisomerase-4 subunit A